MCLTLCRHSDMGNGGPIDSVLSPADTAPSGKPPHAEEAVTQGEKRKDYSTQYLQGAWVALISINAWAAAHLTLVPLLYHFSRLQRAKHSVINLFNGLAQILLRPHHVHCGTFRYVYGSHTAPASSHVKWVYKAPVPSDGHQYLRPSKTWSSQPFQIPALTKVVRLQATTWQVDKGDSALARCNTLEEMRHIRDVNLVLK
ncbi:hypothetical protein QBC40DRAFT_322292 [Triangularia verruculosa]|uniref:Uncharacterized protein n=1 Tax=Triangularia verruculosa TaxID=2587418 RepID=A0AAN7AXH1_9PEZI|nr:hypothetical protein QBC40DRAFT_322292 [Triangularia verruculosa]